ncbi:MAG: ABC transporter substrate-binding protein [Candidatus Rokubacteria bacterium]|nr:ABC transporter substrate-binding protein [Candidatus Rokubacteria bacterium]
MEKALAAWLLLASASPALMVGPTEVIRVAVEQVVQVSEDADLGRPAAAERRRLEVRRIAEKLFDFPEMARRSLARHWTDRTAEQREEFVRLFTDLLERVYFGKLENYSSERTVYVGETVDGDYATVRSKILTGRKGELPIEYRLHLVGSRWAVYDVLIDGMSFVSTYRAQFNRVIQTSSYDDLVQKLRMKELENSAPERNVRKP